MKSWKALSFALLGVVLFLSVVVLRIGYFGESATRFPILVDVKATVAKTLATEEAQTETEGGNLPTSADVQTDTEATEAPTTPKPVNPAVELTLLRHTSVGQVRAG